MPTSSELELRRQLEEPLGGESRNYPLDDSRALITMIDTPYYPPYIPDALHIHNCMEIGVCLAGWGQVHLRQTNYAFSAGSVIVAPRGVYHNQTCAGEPLTHWLYIVLNEDHLLRKTPERYRSTITALLESIRESGLFLENSVDNSINAMIKLMLDLRRRDDADAEIQLELCAYLLLMELSRYVASMPLPVTAAAADPRRRQPIEPALAYVYEHYKEAIQIADLARSCSMSESYFRKQFLKIMGLSPMEHVNRYRIHRAMNLLRTTSDPIQNIAVRAGFSSIAAFNRNFKQFSGLSPSEWRRSRLNK
ncbi:MAG: helix-turn-helix domain-containing protein [Clostridia bacterium]|nr:helix-turn-helix domain-containing protein [Clostridia bacterium]